jgi:hypothetical protein
MTTGDTSPSVGQSTRVTSGWKIEKEIRTMEAVRVHTVVEKDGSRPDGLYVLGQNFL